MFNNYDKQIKSQQNQQSQANYKQIRLKSDLLQFLILRNDLHCSDCHKNDLKLDQTCHKSIDLDGSHRIFANSINESNSECHICQNYKSKYDEYHQIIDECYLMINNMDFNLINYNKLVQLDEIMMIDLNLKLCRDVFNIILFNKRLTDIHQSDLLDYVKNEIKGFDKLILWFEGRLKKDLTQTKIIDKIISSNYAMNDSFKYLKKDNYIDEQGMNNMRQLLCNSTHIFKTILKSMIILLVKQEIKINSLMRQVLNFSKFPENSISPDIICMIEVFSMYNEQILGKTNDSLRHLSNKLTIHQKDNLMNLIHQYTAVASKYKQDSQLMIFFDQVASKSLLNTGATPNDQQKFFTMQDELAKSIIVGNADRKMANDLENLFINLNMKQAISSNPLAFNAFHVMIVTNFIDMDSKGKWNQNYLFTNEVLKTDLQSYALGTWPQRKKSFQYYFESKHDISYKQSAQFSEVKLFVKIPIDIADCAMSIGQFPTKLLQQMYNCDKMTHFKFIKIDNETISNLMSIGQTQIKVEYRSKVYKKIKFFSNFLTKSEEFKNFKFSLDVDQEIPEIESLNQEIKEEPSKLQTLDLV